MNIYYNYMNSRGYSETLGAIKYKVTKFVPKLISNPIFFEIPCVKYKKIFYFWEKKYFFRNEQKNVKIM